MRKDHSFPSICPCLEFASIGVHSRFYQMTTPKTVVFDLGTARQRPFRSRGERDRVPADDEDQPNGRPRTRPSPARPRGGTRPPPARGRTWAGRRPSLPHPLGHRRFASSTAGKLRAWLRRHRLFHILPRVTRFLDEQMNAKPAPAPSSRPPRPLRRSRNLNSRSGPPTSLKRTP